MLCNISLLKVNIDRFHDVSGLFNLSNIGFSL